MRDEDIALVRTVLHFLMEESPSPKTIELRYKSVLEQVRQLRQMEQQGVGGQGF